MLPSTIYMTKGGEAIPITNDTAKKNSTIYTPTNLAVTSDESGRLLFSVFPSPSLYVISPPTPVKLFSSVSLIGFYITYILVVANSLIRPMFTNYLQRLLYTEMASVEVLLIFTAGIYNKR